MRDIGIIIAIGVLVLFTNLGGPRLWDRDEPRNAQCAAEMLAANDWVVPVFNAELRTHKPIMLYWLTMSAYATMGVHEFSARFWSALLGIGTALLTYGIGGQLFSRQAGLWSAIVLLTCLMFNVVARAATPDSTLIFFCTLAMWLFVQFAPIGSKQDHHWAERSWRYPFPDAWSVAVAVYAAMGLAVLTKGPVGLVLPTACLGMFCLWIRNPVATQDNGWRGFGRRLLMAFETRHFLRTCWAMRPITAILTAAAVALPWYVWVGIRTDGLWLREFLGEHNLGRATQVMEGHQGPFLFYLVALMLGCFPWSVLTVPVVLESRRAIRDGASSSDGYIFCWSWSLVCLIAFSMARTKLPSYITPMYPAAALLVGVYLTDGLRQIQLPALHRWVPRAMVTLILSGLAISIGLGVAGHHYLGGDWLPAFSGLIPLVGGIAGLLAVRRQGVPAVSWPMGISAVALSVALFALLSTRIGSHQQYGQLTFPIRQDHSAGKKVASLGPLEPSWVFYGGEPIRQFGDEETQQSAEFLATGPNRYLITTPDHLEGLSRHLARPPVVVAEAPYFLKDRQLILVKSNDIQIR